MYYTLEITGTANEANIVSTADLKTFLRVDHSDEDTLIEALRSAAIEYVQNYCNVQLGDVTGDFAILQRPQAQACTHHNYITANCAPGH